MKEKGFVNCLILAGKLFVLNLLWILCSIPLVTIGASTCALCYVSLKLINGQKGNIFAWFFKSVKANIKQGTLMWLFALPAFYGVYLCWSYITREGGGFFLIIGALIYTLIMTFAVIYTFPVISHYENTFKKQIRNSIIISLQNFSTTCFLILFAALCVIVWTLNKYTMIAGLFIFPVVIFFIICSKLNPIFKRLEENQ